jgi:hypothetical protein
MTHSDDSAGRPPRGGASPSDAPFDHALSDDAAPVDAPLDAELRAAAAHYNRPPPDVPADAMWAAIEARRAERAPRGARRARGRSPACLTPGVPRGPGSAARVAVDAGGCRGGGATRCRHRDRSADRPGRSPTGDADGRASSRHRRVGGPPSEVPAITTPAAPDAAPTLASGVTAAPAPGVALGSAPAGRVGATAVEQRRRAMAPSVLPPTYGGDGRVGSRDAGAGGKAARPAGRRRSASPPSNTSHAPRRCSPPSRAERGAKPPQPRSPTPRGRETSSPRRASCSTRRRPVSPPGARCSRTSSSCSARSPACRAPTRPTSAP